jgi:phage protein D
MPSSGSGSTSRSSAPAYSVTIGSTTMTQPEGDGVLTIVIEDHVDMVSMLTVRLGGAETQPEWSFNIGDEVEATVGEGNVLLFKGHVTALEPSWTMDGGTTLTVRALDPLHILGRGRKTRYWEDVLDSDIVSEVGAECGLSTNVEATSDSMPYVLQRNESTFGDQLRSLRISYNSADQVSGVTVRGWDISAKEEVVGEATYGDISQIGSGDIGAQQAETHFGETTAYITDVPVATQSQANAIALAEMERLSRQFARGTGTVQGNENLRAGTVVNFSGLNAPFDGAYYVLASRHIISLRTGYTTEFTFCSNSFGS